MAGKRLCMTGRYVRLGAVFLDLASASPSKAKHFSISSSPPAVTSVVARDSFGRQQWSAVAPSSHLPFPLIPVSKKREVVHFKSSPLTPTSLSPPFNSKLRGPSLDLDDRVYPQPPLIPGEAFPFANPLRFASHLFDPSFDLYITLWHPFL